MTARARLPWRRLPWLLLPWLLLGAILALTGVPLPLAATEAPATVRVRAGQHDGFGRLVFDWDRPRPFTATVEGDRLIVRFDAPFVADYRRAERLLQPWIGTAEPAADERSVSFPLKRPLTVRTFHHKRSAVIDLLPSAATAPPRHDPAATPTAPAAPSPTVDPPAQLPAQPAAAPLIGVRTGEHDGFSRLVFDWPRPVGYRIDRTTDRVTVTFDAAARFRLPRAGRTPARRIPAVAAAPVDAGSAVTLTVPRNARVRDLRVGNRIVVDVFAADTARTETARTETADPAAAPQPALSEAAAPEAAAPSPPAREPAVTKPPAATALPATAPPAIAPPAIAPPATAIPARETAKEPAAAAPATTPSGDSAADSASPDAAVDPAVDAAVDAVVDAAVDPAVDAAVDADRPQVLRFPWSDPVAAAVFRRGDQLWIVFDAPATFDPALLTVPGVIRAVEAVPVARATALRLHVAADVHPHVRRDGLAWLVEFAAAPQPADAPLVPEVRLDSPVGPSVVLADAGPGRLITVTDPEVGDEISVVPLLPLRRGVERPYDYPQFRLLASAQGVAIVPRTTDLLVRTLERGIEITATGELHVSQVPAAARSRQALGAGEPLSRALAPEDWREPGDVAFAAERQRLLQAAVVAEPESRERARLDLARFYLGRGFGVEGLGVLRVIAADRPAIADSPAFRLMQGIGLFLAGRHAEAATEFAHSSLAGIDEAALWRAATLAAAGRPAAAAEAFAATGAIALGYPTALRAPVIALAAEALAAASRAEPARPYLDVLAAELPGVVPSARLAYLEGRWHEAAGEIDAALDRYDVAARGTDRPSRAKAMFAATELRLEHGLIDPATAIAALDALRVEWRGDALEHAVLRRLGGLAIAEGRYAEGLRALRSAATHFPDAPEAADVAGEMARTFERLYLKGGADALPPVQAIALYDEFRELTPAGDAGNEMIRRLADRLVAVDLLDRAADLLEDQVRLRLEGAERGRIGARLALIYLLDNRPEAALAALASSAEGDTADVDGTTALRQQRGRLRARALVELGRTEAALAALAGDDGVEADLVRAELFWRVRDWPRAGDALRRVAAASGAEAGQPLDEQQARFVLNRAVALTLDGNEADLASLRSAFGPAMNATAYGDAFRLIAAGDTGSEAGLVDTLERDVAAVEGFQAFLAVYRDRLRTGGLSAIN